jgi:hypothetical protein
MIDVWLNDGVQLDLQLSPFYQMFFILHHIFFFISALVFDMEVITMVYLQQQGSMKIFKDLSLKMIYFRIIWAIDLELWYLRSLKFVMALKFLGPKLFMLKNMVS